jgi:hypothetical protein
MKCYAIKLPSGEYLLDCKQAISWRRPEAKATDDVLKARHYKTEAIAKATIKRQATERRNNAERQMKIHEEVQAGNHSFWGDKDYYKKTAEVYIASADFIETLTVVEVDVNTPSFVQKAQPDIKFETNRYKTGFSIEKSQGNCYCKVCGIYFKGIPHLAFKGGFRGGKARICPWCMIERIHEAQKLIDDMDDEKREEIEAERFLHRMD